MKKIICFFVLISVYLAGCKKGDEFLTKLPLDQLTDQTYWTSENNVRTFAWGFYPGFFVGFGSSYSGGQFFSRQSLNDDFAPQTPTPFDIAVPSSGGGWSFSVVRKTNIFIDRVKTVPMSQEAIENWTGVGRFFRGMAYADLVNRFGDVPYYNKPLTEENDSALYKSRDPRTLVMDSVLADFKYAAEHVRESDAATGAKGLIVNKYVVLAFMSRIFLFEGTWQKYHGGDQAKAAEYLQAAQWAANEVITKGGYSVGPDYHALCSSESLSGNPEIILYREYASGLLTHTIMSLNNLASQSGASKDLIEAYLCKDGLPISLSLQYQGDKTIQDVMANRDPRITATFATAIRLPGIDADYSSSGYASRKFLNESLANTLEGTLDNNVTDAPVIRLGEVLLDYAEAAAELGTLSQADLDISINKLRDRKGVNLPHLQVIAGKPAVNGIVYDDPKRDPSVPALLWEIRRERRTELVFEGFRLDDLRRWGKLAYTDTQANKDINRGAWIKKSEHPGTSVKIEGGAAEGYIIPSPVNQRVFNDPKVYLNPLPLDQITLYKDHGVTLTQNPGW